MPLEQKFKPRIQIAGVRDEKEARMLVEEGVDDLGFPMGPGVMQQDLSETQAAQIIQSLKSPVFGVLITYLNNPKEILEFCERLGVRKVQIHGDILAGDLRELKQLAPELYILKSLVVTEENAKALETTAADLSPCVDAFITDTYDPLTGHRGATGKVHDWQVSRKLVYSISKPILLAGGLTPQNVAQAISEVGPAGVDSHTGVEAPDGSKDRAKVRLFVKNARLAFSKQAASDYSG